MKGGAWTQELHLAQLIKSNSTQSFVWRELYPTLGCVKSRWASTMLKCTSLSRHVCGARSSPYASYLTVYKRGERNECGFETRPLENWMMGSWLRGWQEKERFTRNEEKKIQRYRILVFSSTRCRLNLLRWFFLCYVRSCDSPKGTVSFKTGLILIARVLISKKRINFLKMSCDWRIRRITPIASKWSSGSSGGGREARPPPLFLDQTEARRVGKKIETPPPRRVGSESRHRCGLCYTVVIF